MSNTNPSYNNILTNLMSAMNHSSSSLMSTSADNSTIFGSGRPQPLLQGCLHKLHKMKTKKQKYFVIFEDCPDNPGRLEYFDTEKKFRTTLKSNNNEVINTKRSITLRSCFNINRRMDTKYKFVIGLYRKDDCFSIILKDDEELNKWLKMLLVVQRGKELLDGDQPRPTFGKFNFLFFIFNHQSIFEFIWVNKHSFFSYYFCSSSACTSTNNKPKKNHSFKNRNVIKIIKIDLISICSNCSFDK